MRWQCRGNIVDIRVLQQYVYLQLGAQCSTYHSVYLKIPLESYDIIDEWIENKDTFLGLA